MFPATIRSYILIIETEDNEVGPQEKPRWRAARAEVWSAYKVPRATSLDLPRTPHL